ncbi:MSB3 GTPase-activating protein GYP3 [Candida maltosa Xu316]
MIRKGIPPEWRGNAWFFYAGGYERLNKNKGVYDKIVKDTTNIKNKDTEVIERDLNRTFPDNIYFNPSIVSSTTNSSETLQEPVSIKSLRKVLVAFAHYQPVIGYCQSLNFLAGLLLIFMDEEKAFWMLVILTERIIPKVHSTNLEGVHTDQGVLMLCVKEYIPQLWQVLGKNFDGETLSEDKILTRLPPVTLVTSSWFMSVFVGILPIETTLRVWDILWYEGSKTIFRFSLTIFKLCLDSPEFKTKQQANGASETEQIELFQFMQNFPKKILDANLLVDRCFKKIGGYGYGSLSQDEINKCREFVSKQREKLNKKMEQQNLTDMTDEERRSLINSSKSLEDLNIHEVYEMHRPLMSGMVWNKNISNKMKKKFNTGGKRNSSK